MIRDANLYFNLVTDEDSLTELLANCLQFPAFRVVFAGFVADKLGLPGFSLQYESVQTQKHLGKLGRPDLVIEDESVCIFVECKVTDFRGLTLNQPDSYLKYLATQAGKQTALMFIVPYFYEHETLIRQRVAQAHSPVRVEIVYWNDLIARLDGALIAGESLALEHFLALLRAWFDVQPILFSEEDIMVLQNREVVAQLQKLIELVMRVSYKLPKSFKLQKVFNEYGFGYYIKNQAGEYVLWYGCSYDYWQEKGSLLQIGVGEDELEDFSQKVIKRFKKKFGEESWYQSWQWYVVPISHSMIASSENDKKLVKFIADAAAWCNGDVQKLPPFLSDEAE